jgi:hypothetical protein
MRSGNLARAAVAAALALSAAVAQSVEAAADTDVAARYTIRGTRRAVPRVELGLELARRQRHTPRGLEALDLLVDRELVTRAAAEAGLTPTAAEIERRVRELERQLASQNTPLADFLRDKNLSRVTFERNYVGPSIAHERLVMRAMKLADVTAVTPELLALWLEEQRERVGVEKDMGKLPAGVVARVGERVFGLAELGEVLLENAPVEEREHAVRQIVIRALLGAEAETESIEVTREEMVAEVRARKARIEIDSRFGGVAFEDLLKAQGTTIEELEGSATIRAQVQRQKLLAQRFDDAAVRESLAADREGALARHGARRHLHVILIRALDEPNQLVRRDFAAAETAATELRQRIKDGYAFADAARVHSEDPYSKPRGGDVGEHPLVSDRVPIEVTTAAFAARPGEVEGPIRTKHGCWLVMVSEVGEPPAEEVLLQRLREELGEKWLAGLVEEASIEIVASR